MSIAGVVRSLNVRHTKSGSGIFGNLVLEDLKGSVEVVIFNDLLRKSLPMLEDKVDPVIIKGFTEPGEDRVKLRATDIKPLRDLRNGATVHINFPKENTTREHLVKAREIISSYPGESQIQIHLNTEGGVAVLEVEDLRVGIEDAFISEVEDLLGKNALRFN